MLLQIKNPSKHHVIFISSETKQTLFLIYNAKHWRKNSEKKILSLAVS